MERLSKIIANCGYTSRRNAEKLIVDNHVSVNGEIVNVVGTKCSKSAIIEIDGIKLHNEEKVYFLLYKPRGVVSTSKDEHKRKTVIDLINTTTRIYPVGRLDYDTTGVLLLTNDGELTNLLTHPKNNIEKIYIAKIKGQLLIRELKLLEKGIMINNKKTSPAKIKIRKYDKVSNTSIIQLTIHEGMYHQVKEMFKAVNKDVVKLKREVFAGFTTMGLKSGEYRKLNSKEVKILYGMLK